MNARSLACTLLLCTLAACSSGARSSFVPQTVAQRTAQDSMGALPGDSMGALPGGAAWVCPPSGSGAHCLAEQNTGILPLSNSSASPLQIPGWQPADLAAAYRLPTAAGGGQTVAIVDAYDDPFAESDLAIYRSTFGLPPCTSVTGCFRKVGQQGQTGVYPASNFAWATEISLDLDMVSAACPQCRILLVEANSASLDDLGAAVDEAVALGANVVSNSYDAPEYPGETGEDVHYDHPGVPIVASSGDEGVPAYPAVSKYVTSVGGTTLSNAGGSWSQTAWSYDGHGCSAYESRPKWQPPTDGCPNARSAVDVAAVADPQTGVAVYDDFVQSGQAGGWIVVGGTSVAAPLVAAAYALAANGAHIANASYAYAHSAAFTDVAPAGFDAVTGLGAPLGVGGF